MRVNALVVYDSKFGNTERIAREIAEVVGAGEAVPVIKADAVDPATIGEFELLVIGGPTQGHGLSPTLSAFLEALPDGAIRGVAVATFDTRLTWPRVLSGSAASSAARRLRKSGARVVIKPESFLVSGGEGPLADGELERSRAWARELMVEAGYADAQTARTSGSG